jgi:hypothetical protein
MLQQKVVAKAAARAGRGIEEDLNTALKISLLDQSGGQFRVNPHQLTIGARHKWYP